MYFPLAYVTVVAVYYFARVICDDRCFNIDQVQVAVDSNGADYLPCEPSASISSCCPLGWMCFSNGLCEPLPGNTTQNLGSTSLYTGFCTDALWSNDTICPKVCNNNVTLGANVGNGIVACPNGDFCCYGEGEDQCCSTSSNVFSLGVATEITTLASPRPTTTTPTIITPMITTPTATGTFPRTSSTSTGAIISNFSSTTPASVINSAAAVASNLVATPAPKAGPSHDAVIGLGVGVGAAVGLAILAGFIYLARRRSKKSPEGPLYVDGKSEMDAVASERKETRVNNFMAERHLNELAGENTLVEIGEQYGPRAEMG